MLSRCQPTFHSHSETLPPPDLSRSASPLLATLTDNLQFVENPATLSPFPATLMSRVKHKSFICHSYRKHPGWGYAKLAVIPSGSEESAFLDPSPNQLLQILLRAPHILHLLLPRNLPLNRHRSRILHLLQPRNNPRKTHLPLPY